MPPFMYPKDPQDSPALADTVKALRSLRDGKYGFSVALGVFAITAFILLLVWIK